MLFRSRAVLLRALLDHAMQLNCDKVIDTADKIARAIPLAGECLKLEELRGIEGEAANVYFSVFDLLILQNKKDFLWHGRTQRPPNRRN